jgi:hypothetical protein
MRIREIVVCRFLSLSANCGRANFSAASAGFERFQHLRVFGLQRLRHKLLKASNGEIFESRSDRRFGSISALKLSLRLVCDAVVLRHFPIALNQRFRHGRACSPRCAPAQRVPAIHVLDCREDVDARHKLARGPAEGRTRVAGHDGG